MIHVVSPGMLTTVQDLGREGYTHWGVSPAGAADDLALRAGNLLVGNEEGEAALEMTIVGATLQFEVAAFVAITGADAPLDVDGDRRPPWAAFPVGLGQRLRIGTSSRGGRMYLCVAGGFVLSKTLGSVSTHAGSGLGPEPLRRGQQLIVRSTAVPTVRIRRRVPVLHLEAQREFVEQGAALVRVTTGPQWGAFSDSARRSLQDETFEVREESSRMGIRLRGPVLDSPFDGEMATQGVPLGAIQVPKDGQPIVLFVDAQTTGGYPVAASVISADRWRLGQLRPGDKVRFRLVDIETAWLELQRQEEWLHSLRHG